MSKKEQPSFLSGVQKIFSHYVSEEDKEFEDSITSSLEKFSIEEKKRKRKDKKSPKKNTKNTKSKKIPFWLDLILSILILGVLLFVFRTYVFSPFNVEGQSMEGTLHNGEFIYVDRLIPLFSGYKRGDVVVVFPPADSTTDETGLICIYDKAKNILLFQGKQDPCHVKATYVKRIIAIEGDIVEINAGHVYITPQGEEKKEVSEHFLQNANQGNTFLAGTYGWDKKIVKIFPPVPKDSILVMGDNRLHSADSRALSWKTPFIHQDNIVGIARAVFLSPPEIMPLGKTKLEIIVEQIRNIPASFSGIRRIKSENLLGEE